jgi:hypothetical protein
MNFIYKHILIHIKQQLFTIHYHTLGKHSGFSEIFSTNISIHRLVLSIDETIISIFKKDKGK